MATRSSKCKTCGTRTTASAGYCQRCKSLRHHGHKRLKEENLLLDEAGGAWWVWDARGDVVVAGKPTRDAAIIALGEGADADDSDDVELHDHARKKTPAQLDRDIAAALARVPGTKPTGRLAEIDREAKALEARYGDNWLGYPADVSEKHRELFAESLRLQNPHAPEEFSSRDKGIFYLTDGNERALGSEFNSRSLAKREAGKLVREGRHAAVEVWHRWRGGRYMQGRASEDGWSDV